MNNESAFGQTEMDKYLDRLVANAYSKVPEDDPDALSKALYHIGMDLYQTEDPTVGYRFTQAYLSGGEFYG